MVNWWFGSRWFGILVVPLTIPFTFGGPKYPTHQPQTSRLVVSIQSLKPYELRMSNRITSRNFNLKIRKNRSNHHVDICCKTGTSWPWRGRFWNNISLFCFATHIKKNAQIETGVHLLQCCRVEMPNILETRHLLDEYVEGFYTSAFQRHFPHCQRQFAYHTVIAPNNHCILWTFLYLFAQVVPIPSYVFFIFFLCFFSLNMPGTNTQNEGSWLFPVQDIKICHKNDNNTWFAGPCRLMVLWLNRKPLIGKGTELQRFLR